MDRLAASGGKTVKEMQKEDCLVLNVWTPAVKDGRKRPVMFWCHGGGFTMGSGSASIYDGTNLARRGDVVIVTINHRLGPFGYLYLGDISGEEFAISSNAGMQDIVMALEWVRENITSFGGDPNNVTLFGESGGGYKVSVLMAMPTAAGLFHRAIVESGPGWRMMPKEIATEQANKLLKELGVSIANLGKLYSLSVEQILDAGRKINRNIPFGWWPVVDGKVLPWHPFDPVAPDISANIPLIIGTNKDEATLFLSAEYRRSRLGDGPAAKIARNIWFHTATPRIAHRIAGKSAKSFLATYREGRQQSSDSELFSAMMTDWMMRIPSIIQAERKYAQHSAPVFMYLFSWETPILNGRLKATHGLEIPFVFDNIGSGLLTGTGRTQSDLARNMSETWISFARSGVPNYAGIPNWSPYDPDERVTMIFDQKCRVENDPFKSERIAWNGIEPLDLAKAGDKRNRKGLLV
jgi:para-nitrobenzyl esterase